MLDMIRKGQRWMTAIFVVGIGLVFAVFIGAGGPIQGGRGGAIITVGEHQVGRDEFFRMRERQAQLYANALGDNFDARAMRDTIDAGTANVLVEGAVLALEAERLGLTVAKEEVERSLLMNPIFRDETGAFDRERFEIWIERNFGSERVFRNEQRRSDLATKLIRVLNTQAYVSEGEARTAVEQRLEQVKLAFPILSVAAAGDDIERDEAALAEFATSRADEIQGLYDSRIDQYDVPEQAHARHILLSVAPTADQAATEEVRATALELRGRLEAGEDFAVLAQEFSADPGSAANGGDLGWFRRGQMVASFDEAAFGLEIGTLSEPVKSDFGFHLIRVEERKPAELRTLDDVRGDLAFELQQREAGRATARATAEALSEAVRGGQTLEAAARDAELTLERTNWVKRRPDGFIPGLGASPDLLAVAFSLEPGESSDRIFEVGDQFALVQVLEREANTPEDLSEQIEAEQEQLRRQKLETLIGVWIADRRNQLAADGELIVDLTQLN